MPQKIELDFAGLDIKPVRTAPFPIWIVTANSNEPMCSMVTAAERERASRFRTRLLQDRYVSAHAALRLLVAAETGQPPTAQRYGATSDGKPYLLDDPDLSFSLSYSGDRALIAVDRGPAIGVDLEQIRPIDDRRELADLYFTAQERAWIDGEQKSDHRFLNIWTRKEACVKAIGVGLRMPLHLIDCGMEMRAAPVCADPHLLHVGSLDGLDGYVAAWARIIEPPVLTCDRQGDAESFGR